MEMGGGNRVAFSSALAATTITKLAEKSSPVVITTQTGTDGYREKAMRIASVEQVELGNIMELSVTGSCVQIGETIKTLWGGGGGGEGSVAEKSRCYGT